MTSEAEEFFREAFLAAPNKFEGHYRAALALLKSEQYEKALVELDAGDRPRAEVRRPAQLPRRRAVRACARRRGHRRVPPGRRAEPRSRGRRN